MDLLFDIWGNWWGVLYWGSWLVLMEGVSLRQRRRDAVRELTAALRESNADSSPITFENLPTGTVVYGSARGGGKSHVLAAALTAVHARLVNPGWMSRVIDGR